MFTDSDEWKLIHAYMRLRRLRTWRVRTAALRLPGFTSARIVAIPQSHVPTTALDQWAHAAGAVHDERTASYRMPSGELIPYETALGYAKLMR